MLYGKRHDSVHIFDVIYPERGAGPAIIMPSVNPEAVNEHLAKVGTQIAAWRALPAGLRRRRRHQQGDRLIVPENITALPLPPYSPYSAE